MKKSFLLAALCVASMATTASANPWGWAFAPVRRYVGPQIRMASPYAYSGLLAANRSIPPQVKNNMNNAMNPYRGGGTPWNAELNFWRSMPPEVRNNLVRQQQQGNYGAHHQAGYVQPPPQVIYVPVPVSSAPVSHGAGAANTVVIPAPPPPLELPRIIRP